jgi:inorganic triphosphatase YgiF
LSAGETVTLPPTETEAKLYASARAFAEIERAEEIAGWRVVERRTVCLRDTYWDTPDLRLGRQGCTLRVRELDGAREAELTYKGALRAEATASASRSRTEIVVPAPAGSTPAAWARLPAAAPVLDALRDSGAARGLRPDLVLVNPRREIVLRHAGGADEADEAVLTLDTVEIERQPYRRRYVEIELRRGSRTAMDTLVAAAAQRFGLRPARLGKVAAARVWQMRRAAHERQETDRAAR